MKVKKYAEDPRSLSLAQKLQTYKEASVGLTNQQSKTAFAFAAGSLAALMPFVSQAQCGTGTTTLNLPQNVPVLFDVDGNGVNDINFSRGGSYTQMFPINGAAFYVATGGYAKKFNQGETIQNNAAKFQTGQNYLCGFFGGNFCGSPITGILGIKLSASKIGFVKITKNATNVVIDLSKTGVTSSAPALSQLKAGDCTSLSASMPVELTNFSAKPMSQHINLAWSTASEKDNAYFAIERSRNGVDFTAIGQVKGNGTTSAAYDYGFVDQNVVTEGVYYYRLKQVDNDGTFTYSAVASAQLHDATKVKVYPTAVRHNVVNIETSNDKLPTTVVDMTGRVLKQFTTTPNQIDVSDLGAGVYMVRVGSQVTRIVKSN